MHQEQRERAEEFLKSKGIERGLFSSPATVRWLTGFAPPIQLGPSVFEGGPALVWYDGGHWTLMVLDSYVPAAGAFGDEPNCQVVSYLGYTIEQSLASTEHLSSLLLHTVAQSQIKSGKLGIEVQSLPVNLWNVLTVDVPHTVERVAIDGWCEPLRMVKTAEELQKLRDNFALTDIGHAAARRAVHIGAREIDVWTAIHSAIEQAAGQRVPMGNDCIVGHRPANIGGSPGDLKIEPNDSVIVDLSTLLHGYWSDSCATYYANELTSKQIEMHRTAEIALQVGMNMIRPGVVAREIDQKLRDLIREAGYPVYPHHSGHGVGVTGHEAPRIVPYSTEVLQAGMVIMLEPGIYFPGETGVRLEDALLVTSDGAEILTHHDKSLPAYE